MVKKKIEKINWKNNEKTRFELDGISRFIWLFDRIAEFLQGFSCWQQLVVMTGGSCSETRLPNYFSVIWLEMFIQWNSMGI